MCKHHQLCINPYLTATTKHIENCNYISFFLVTKKLVERSLCITCHEATIVM